MTDERRRVADAAVAAEQLASVVAVDVIPPEQDPLDRWVLDLLVEQPGHSVGLPPRVHQLLADHELGSHSTKPQGPSYYQVLAVP